MVDCFALFSLFRSQLVDTFRLVPAGMPGQTRTPAGFHLPDVQDVIKTGISLHSIFIVASLASTIYSRYSMPVDEEYYSL